MLIAGKDLRQRLRDRSALLMAVVLPLVLAFVFDMIFGSAAVPRAFRYGVVDLDRGHIAAAFVDDVLRPIEAQGVLQVRPLASVDEARRLASAGDLDAAFVLPAGFTSAVQGQTPAEIQVLGNVDSPTGTDVARSIARSFAAELNSVRLAVAASLPPGRPVPTGQVADLATRAAAGTRPLVLRDVSAAAKLLDLKTFFPASMAVFFLFFTVQFGVASLLDERAEGTLARLLAAPVPARSVLAGKLLTSVLLGVASTSVLVVATSLLMGARWGNPLGVALLVLAGVLAATGVTSLVAALAHNAEQAGSWGAIIAIILGLLGGVFFPISQVGGVVAAASLATPHAWFMRGLGELHAGGGPASVLPAVGAILIFAVVTFGFAALRLERVLRP
jgi:ABC-2 type transport system permease protein